MQSMLGSYLDNVEVKNFTNRKKSREFHKSKEMQSMLSSYLHNVEGAGDRTGQLTQLTVLLSIGSVTNFNLIDLRN